MDEDLVLLQTQLWHMTLTLSSMLLSVYQSKVHLWGLGFSTRDCECSCDFMLCCKRQSAAVNMSNKTLMQHLQLWVLVDMVMCGQLWSGRLPGHCSSGGSFMYTDHYTNLMDTNSWQVQVTAKLTLLSGNVKHSTTIVLCVIHLYRI